jgi:hypothetical protein
MILLDENRLRKTTCDILADVMKEEDCRKVNMLHVIRSPDSRGEANLQKTLSFHVLDKTSKKNNVHNTCGTVLCTLK